MIFQTEILRKLGLSAVPNITAAEVPRNRVIKNLIHKETMTTIPRVITVTRDDNSYLFNNLNIINVLPNP